MTLFEYLAIAFSLILSSSALRLIRGLSWSLERHRRYWVHSCLVLNQLGVTLSIFWVFWSYRDVEWTFPFFVAALAGPGLVYAAACALVPEDPADVGDWRAYYYAARKRFYSCAIAWALVAAFDSSVILGMSWSHPARVFQALALGTSVAGIATPNPRVHAVIALVFLGAVATSAGTVALRAGSLTQ
jgi:hypothetical protein